MLRNIVWGVLILTITACNDRKPEGILTEQEMVSVMTELYLVEEKVGKLPVSYDSIQKLKPIFSKKAFEKIKVSDSLFRKSLEYYMTDPVTLENIYTTLVDSLNLKAQRFRTPE